MFIAQLSGQFPHCGNAFRVDTYKGCSFNCVYCFTNCRGGNYSKKYEHATDKQINKLASYIHGNNDKTLVCELIKRRVPIHCGGLSDPFQHRENDLKITHSLVSKLIKYPIMFSTKTDHICNDTMDILDPNYHVFQISITGIPENIIKDIEPRAPTTESRIYFAKKLKSMGFTVFIRIQPLINIEWALDVVNKTGDIVDGITIEHLKIPNDNHAKFKLLSELSVDNGIKSVFKCNGREYEFQTTIKEKNILKIKKLNKKCKILVGDNDCRMLSDGVNCCGLEYCPDSFKNWIKCNSMYMKKIGITNEWAPKTKVKKRGDFGYGINWELLHGDNDYKWYVMKNYRALYGDPDQYNLFNIN